MAQIISGVKNKVDELTQSFATMKFKMNFELSCRIYICGLPRQNQAKVGK